MAQQPPPITLRGDEAQLFATHHDRLLRAVRRRVNAPDAVIEDAASITWLILMRRQPERGPALFGWLVTVAEREAWRLAARGVGFVEFDELTCADTPTDDGVETMINARTRLGGCRPRNERAPAAHRRTPGSRLPLRRDRPAHG